MNKFIQKVQPVAKTILPTPLYKNLVNSYFRFRRKKDDIPAILKFLLDNSILRVSFFERCSLVKRFVSISANIECQHKQSEILSFVRAFLSIPPEKEGVIVEAGSYKGGSTAKFSIAAKLANRQLIVFDSFEGLPENEEAHDRSILGHSIKEWFTGGKYCGTLDEVKSNVEKYGELERCTFIKGWFEDTMPTFSNKICAAYLDVDLASSTKTCPKNPPFCF